MQNLIDAILGNLLFFVIIIGGLISFFTDKKKKQETRNQENQQTQQTSRAEQTKAQKPVTQRAPMYRDRKQSETYSEQMNRSKNQDIKSIDALHEEQLKKIKGSIGSAMTHSNKNDSRSKEKSNKILLESRISTNSSESDESFVRNLTKRHLAESILLAEVLGKPRALKQYSSKR